MQEFETYFFIIEWYISMNNEYIIIFIPYIHRINTCINDLSKRFVTYVPSLLWVRHILRTICHMLHRTICVLYLKKLNEGITEDEAFVLKRDWITRNELTRTWDTKIVLFESDLDTNIQWNKFRIDRVKFLTNI